LETIFDTKTKLGQPFSDSLHLNRVLAKLQLAQQAFKDRKDISPELRTKILDDIKTALEKVRGEIYPAILAYAKSVGIVQLQSNKDAVSSILNVVGLLESSSTLYKLIKELLGDNLDTLIEVIVSAEGIGSYEGALMLLEKVRDIATKEQLEIIINHINTEKAKYVEAVTALGIERVNNMGNVLKGKNYFSNNPMYFASYILRFGLSEEVTKNPQSPVFTYLQDLDLDELMRRLPGDTLLSERDKEIITQVRRAAIKLNYANAALTLLETSTFKAAAASKVKEEEIDNIKPSLQQNLVLNDIMMFLFKKVTTSAFGNWLLFKGVGGSGKTLVVSKLMIKLYEKLTGKDARQSILAISHTPETSANINQAIFGTTNTPTTTYDSLMALTNDQLSKIDLIVVDEVFAMTNEQVEQLQKKLTEHAKETKHIVKVVATGDPSQRINEKQPITLATGSYAMQHTIPLTTSFRTNVGPITSFINNYRMSPNPVTGLPTQSNLSLEDTLQDTSKAFGVQSVSDEELYDLVSSPSTRSRVLVVPDQESAARARSKFGSKINIRTVDQVQGFQ
jgi:DNA replication protein DnaC